MLKIEIPLTNENWDEKKQEFISAKVQTLQLEHSLISLSKWESKWCKPFFAKDKKTWEETIDYIRCMTITPNVDQSVYDRISDSVILQVNKYIESPMTATWFTDRRTNKPVKRNNEQVTSELIYYWMLSCNIPFECEKWHLNRLLTLIQVCDSKNNKDNMTPREVRDSYKALNAARRKKYNTKG